MPFFCLPDSIIRGASTQALRNSRVLQRPPTRPGFVMAETPQLKKLATDGPFLQLTDGRIWQIELGEAYMRTRFWTIGDRIRVEPESDRESFSHTLINVDVPGYDDPVAARPLEDWPEGYGAGPSE